MTTTTAPARSEDGLAPLPEIALRARTEIHEAGQILLEFGTLSTRGRGAYNGGIRLPEGDRYVLGGFGEEAIVVGLDGTIHAGTPTRSLTEIIEVYGAIFSSRPDVNAAIHTHSPYLTAHAIAQRPFQIRYWALAKRAETEQIPLSEWAPRYSAEPIRKAIAADPKAPGVLLRNRGLFVWGAKGIVTLAHLLNSLEEGAEIQVYAEILGGAKPLPEGELDKFLAAKRG